MKRFNARNFQTNSQMYVCFLVWMFENQVDEYDFIWIEMPASYEYPEEMDVEQTANSFLQEMKEKELVFSFVDIEFKD